MAPYPVSSPSSYMTTGGSVSRALNPANLRDQKTAFYSAKATYQSLSNTYNSAIDYGNTDSLIGIIDTSTLPAPLYALLNSHAPYISAAALEATADRHVLRLQPNDECDAAKPG